MTALYHAPAEQRKHKIVILGTCMEIVGRLVLSVETVKRHVYCSGDATLEGHAVVVMRSIGQP